MNKPKNKPVEVVKEMKQLLFRVNQEEYDLIQKAKAITRQNMSEFVAKATIDRAEIVVSTKNEIGKL